MIARVKTWLAAARHRDVFSLHEGSVVITMPKNLSAESLTDLKDYVAIFLRKAERRSAAQPPVTN